MIKNLIVILFLLFAVQVYSINLLREKQLNNFSFTGNRTDSLTCASAINDFFKQALKGYDDFKVEIINLPAAVSSIKFLSGQFDERKTIISIPAEVSMKGKTIKTFLSFHIQLYKQALYASSLIKRQSELKPENFEFRLTEVNNTNGTPIYSFDEIKNAISQRNINPGELLIKEAIGKIPLVKAGDKVKANIVSGGIIVSMDAVSKQNGSENEIIRIITSDKKIFKAKVIDSQNVVIIE